MRFVKPEYFDSFRCIASNCVRSCCVGWEIGVDEVSEYKYIALEYSGDPFIASSISKEEHCFLQDTTGRCRMLDENGLCEIIKRYGEAMLCDICREHPRYYNLLPDRIEGGLGLCCITAAELILSMSLPPRYIYGDTEADYDAFCEPNIAFALLVREWIEEGLSDASPVKIIVERIEKAVPSIDRLFMDVAVKRLTPSEAMFFLKEDAARQDNISLPVISLCDIEPLPRHSDRWVDFSVAANEPSKDEYASSLYRAAHRRLIFYFLHRYLCTEEEIELLSPRLIMAVTLSRLILDVALLRGADSIEAIAMVASEFSESFEYSTENLKLYLRKIEKKYEA